MVTFGQTLTVLNVLIAGGIIILATKSWLTNGWLKQFIDSFQKIDDIDRKVDDLHDWSDDVDDALIAVSEAEDGVDSDAVRRRLDVGATYTELLDQDDIDGEDGGSFTRSSTWEDPEREETQDDD